MNTLTNTLNLLLESVSDAKHYAEQVELILKEKETHNFLLKKGDMLISRRKGSGYGNTFTVIKNDKNGLKLLCNKSGSSFIENNSEDYEMY